MERLEVIGEQVATKEVELEAQDRPDTKQVLREELERERAAKGELEKKLSERRARRLRTHDCKNLLAESFRVAKVRLVIVSAFLSANVVDKWFLERLEGALKRGVKVWIAYGMGKEGDHSRRRESFDWKEAEKRLKELKKQYIDLLQVVDLESTHEKILIRDHDFVVSGSFNWLSFGTDRGKKYRHEDALLVTESAAIDEDFNEITGRFPNTK